MSSNHAASHTPLMQIQLRRALPRDASAMAAVHRTAFETALPWIPRLHTPAEDVAYFSRVIAEQQTALVELKDEVVALAAWNDHWLNQLYVKPGRQGAGLGSELLAHVKRAHADDDGFSLWTFQRNAGARRFYERHGLVATEFTDGAGNEEREPDVRYVWRSTGQPERV